MGMEPLVYVPGPAPAHTHKRRRSALNGRPKAAGNGVQVRGGAIDGTKE